ncbi:MAG: hypothetical protein JWN52_3090 [Actinomycetia bacterium]|jgi:hypothetical protein|nr:hypothetical protein [Actinomycetes bacterium]
MDRTVDDPVQRPEPGRPRRAGHGHRLTSLGLAVMHYLLYIPDPPSAR